MREAERLYQAVLDADRHHFGALNNLGKIRTQRGKLEDAIRLFRRALNQRPSSAETHYNLANALQALNRHEQAIARYERALTIQPHLAEAHNNLGTALQALNRHEESIARYEKALAIKPDYAEAHYNLGNALQALNRHEEAIVHFEKALAIRPDYAEAHNNLGNALQLLNRPQEAIVCYERVLAVNPDDAEAHNNLGNAFRTLKRYEEAIAQFEKVVAIEPNYFQTHYNLGNAFRALNRREDAIGCYEKALAIKPNFAEAQLNESLIRLALGDFEVGWKKYEARWLDSGTGLRKRDFPQPLWQGDGDLSSKTILLYAEQGFGDTLQFARYVPLVAQRGAKVVLEVQGPLAPLLTELKGGALVRAKGEPLPPFDCHCPLLSLPLAFGTTLKNIPAEVPYLAPPADKIVKWRSEIEADRVPRIGLVWAGSSGHQNDRDRSIPLRLLLPLLEMPGFRFVALQKELHDGDAHTLEPFNAVMILGDRLEDFSDTAAIISMLDLVITVDTSVAHLAGALGKPVWVLLPFSPDWRWLLDRDDSPWYPSARLFRQPVIGDWESVVTQVRKAVEDFTP